MADLLQTLLAALAPQSATPSYLGAPVPSEAAAQPPDGMDAQTMLPNWRAQQKMPDPQAISQAAGQPPGQGGGIMDILKNLLSPPDSPNAPHKMLQGLFAGAPPQPPDGMDANTMASGAAPAGGPFPAAAAPAPPPQAQAPVPQGTVVAPPGGGALPPGSPALNSDVVKKLLESLGGGSAAPAAPAAAAPPAPDAAAQRGPAGPRPGATSSISPAPPSGITGDDVVKFIRNVSQGAASVNPRSPKTSAVMQGASGALTSSYNEDERDKALKASRAQEDFKNTLAIRKDARDETGTEAQTKLRNARVDALKNPVAGQGGVTGYKYKMWLAANPGDEQGALDYAGGKKDMAPAQKALAARRLAADEVKNATGPADQAKIDARTQEILKQAGDGGASRSAPSKAAKGGGDGKSQDAPAKPMSMEDMKALPSGAWFVNPADGRVLQKR